MLERRTLDQTKGPHKHVLLAVEALFPGKKIETQSVTVEGEEYVFPSPEAVQAEIFALLKGYDVMDFNPQKNLLALEEPLIKAMKRGRAFLNTAKQEAERALNNKSSEDMERSKMSVDQAISAFEEAAHLLEH